MRLAIALCVAIVSPVAGQVPEPDTFRGEPYLAAVPDSLSGAQVIGAEEALVLWNDGAGFVDVYPRTVKPDGLPEGTIWKEPRHDTIPGAVWLWNTGYEKLTPAEAQRLADGLADLTRDDPDRALVIFCRADCWMSWNAAKRAVELGYQRVNWFPGGIDDWQANLGPDLVRAEPAVP
ncbi:rhodanese-like domain-containing protein [Paracoccus sp. Z330]|uniref:Rhodanese-like domain-containing protein n=1 Tax=Paracoccus onchidii TaxID=3017813 RepID=A0ABT4ZFM1_9RHOB|nr:rhodanese-like domain-containing protein [Paracoccus onchidii]MDB6178181.1 rhodanese-like domain-containing protein [Paracoccus onchidii]